VKHLKSLHKKSVPPSLMKWTNQWSFLIICGNV
jgi:hypothetical protein